MALDNLLRLLGTSDGEFRQTLDDDPAVGSWRFVGKNRSFRAYLRVGGDVLGTNPTLDMLIQHSNDAGSSDGTNATFAQVIDEQVGYIDVTDPRYEVPGEDPIFVEFIALSDYVRAAWTVGGTSTPSFGLVSIELEPLHVASPLRSGVA